MSSTNDIKLATLPVQAGSPLSTREIGELLIKHYGIHEGKFEVNMEFVIGTGPIAPTPETIVPGAMFGVTKIGLVHANPNAGPTAIDAALVNPPPKKPSRPRGRVKE